MTPDATSPDESASEDDTDLPSVNEIIARLDQLWDDLSYPSNTSLQSLTGRRIGHYSLQDKIGYGAFGVVYRAYDPKLQRHVALKIPRPEVVVDREKLKRFESEASVLESLEHPHIVPLYEADLNGPTPHIVMAFVPGPDLAQFLVDFNAEIPWTEATQFVAKLAEAVQYAHEKGVIHRDLKPSNVLLMPKENLEDESESLLGYEPKLTDFGLAKLESSLEDTRSSLLIGTPLYMAPELLRGKKSEFVTPASDIYSLGCLLYELLVAQPPFVGDSYVALLDQIREQTPNRLRLQRSDVPADLEAICAKCLEKDPQARYAQATELAADLRKVASGDKVSIRQPTLFRRFQYWVSLPQRVRDAGWFSLCFNLAAVIWLVLLLMVVRRFIDLSDADYRATRFDALTAICIHTTMAIFARYVLQGNRWAQWAGLAGSLWIILAMGLFYTGTAPIFVAIYRQSPYHKVANIMILLVTASMQLVLYLFAILSTYSRRST